MKYAKKFFILLPLMVLNTLSFSQDDATNSKADIWDNLGKATVTVFGGKTSDPPPLGFSYVKATTFSCDLIYSAIDGVISLLDHHGNPLPQDSVLKVSMIQGTGEDFGFADVSVAGLMFKIFRPNLGGPYIIQKMLAVEMKALENLRPWTYFEMQPPTYHPLSAYGMVNGKKYLISMELALAIGLQGQGKYLITGLNSRK